MIFAQLGERKYDALGHHKMGNVQQLCLNIATQILVRVWERAYWWRVFNTIHLKVVTIMSVLHQE